MRRILFASIVALTSMLAFAVRPADAQIDILSGEPFQANGPMADEEVVSVTGEFTAAAAGQPAQVTITADMQPGWHIYSTTQAPGGPIRTQIKLDKSQQFRLLGEFKPTSPPEQHKDEEVWGDLLVEEHKGSVSWQAPIEFAAGVDPKEVKITGAVYAQACATSCIPPTDYKFTASLAASSVGNYRHPNTHVTLEGRLEPATIKPGSVARLVISANPEAGWHIYALADRDPQEISKPTLIVLTETSGLQPKQPVANRAPAEKKGDKGIVTQYHEDPVTWTVELPVPQDMKPGEYPIAGIIGYQTCQETSCDLPKGARFATKLVVGEASTSEAAPLQFKDAKYGEAAKLADARGKEAVEPIAADLGALPLMIVFSLLGGLILNLMPCVLPVIGLKILSFVEQAGQDRARVLALNLWYSIGLISVFMVLATLAVTLNMGWGEQFTSTTFNVIMAALVFVMALSFLGVWEIPIPGFVGTGKATELAAREGAAGAFTKGVITTILATPCSGPFLGSVFGFTLKQPPVITFTIFGFIGLGMASPYLLIGAFPRLIRFLPKPGAWMDTFKHVMGFVLLGSIVLLMTFIHPDYFIPTFALLIGLWAACWWIGQTPLTADLGDKVRAWAQGATFAAAVGLCAFTWLAPHEAVVSWQVQLVPAFATIAGAWAASWWIGRLWAPKQASRWVYRAGIWATAATLAFIWLAPQRELPWQPFSRPALTQLMAEGKTVLVDFTAKWCLTCKTNLKFAINTDEVRKVVEANGVVPLLADWTDGSPEIKEMLASLESKSIPVLAIFPAGRPQEPIILRDLISQQQVIDALRQAGPSSKKMESVMSAMVGDGA